MNRDLFLAILAMDSYNRGYDQGVLLNPEDSRTDQEEAGRKLGNATILNIDLPDGSIEASFYAIAYNWNGETIISYRGTDAPSSDFFAFGIGAGQPFALTGGLTDQARLTVEFYRAVAGVDADPFAANELRGELRGHHTN